MSKGCTFCKARDGQLGVAMILDEPDVLAFLDHRPLFKGHVLVIPRIHTPTLMELDATLVQPVFSTVQRLSTAVKQAFGCDGIFVAANNGVSQSVDHLHVHVVPRRKKDGLRGFMWPRHRYDSFDEMLEFAEQVKHALSAK